MVLKPCDPRQYSLDTSRGWAFGFSGPYLVCSLLYLARWVFDLGLETANRVSHKNVNAIVKCNCKVESTGLVPGLGPIGP